MKKALLGFITITICLVGIAYGISQILAKPKFTSIAPNEFSELIASGDVVLIDVRTREEHESGHIPGTDYNIDVKGNSFMLQSQVLLPNDTPIAQRQSGQVGGTDGLRIL